LWWRTDFSKPTSTTLFTRTPPAWWRLTPAPTHAHHILCSCGGFNVQKQRCATAIAVRKEGSREREERFRTPHAYHHEGCHDTRLHTCARCWHRCTAQKVSSHRCGVHALYSRALGPVVIDIISRACCPPPPPALLLLVYLHPPVHTRASQRGRQRRQRQQAAAPAIAAGARHRGGPNCHPVVLSGSRCRRR